MLWRAQIWPPCDGSERRLKPAGRGAAAAGNSAEYVVAPEIWPAKAISRIQLAYRAKCALMAGM